MAKRKPRGKVAPRKAPAKRVATAKSTWTDKLAGVAWAGLPSIAVVMLGVALWLEFAPRGVPPVPGPTFPVVTLEDTPAAAVTKSHARYILNFGDSLDEFAELAPTFGDSAAAAKWFTDRTARARAEAYGGKDGFDGYVFGHAGGDENGEDRYDAKTLANGAKEMADACRKSAKLIAP